MSFTDGQECLAATGQMTVTLKAQRALMDAGIVAEVRPLLPGQTRRGCAYGVAFPCAMRRAARAALHAAQIPVSQYLGEGGV